jgi:hypothetical protein
VDKKSGSASGMNNTDHISESLETIFWVKMLKFFDIFVKLVVTKKVKITNFPPSFVAVVGYGIRDG